jgi:hypothetical protein
MVDPGCRFAGGVDGGLSVEDPANGFVVGPVLRPHLEMLIDLA